jgi:hypothetical protein
MTNPAVDVIISMGIKGTEDLAPSPNAKNVGIGGKDGLPVMLNADSPGTADQAAPIATENPAALLQIIASSHKKNFRQSAMTRHHDEHFLTRVWPE